MYSKNRSKNFLQKSSSQTIYLNELVKKRHPSLVPYKNTNYLGYYAAMRHALMISRWCGVLPLSGLGQPKGQNVRYTWKSAYTLQFWMSIGFHFFIAGYGIDALCKMDSNVQNDGKISLVIGMSILLVLLIPFSMRFEKMIADVEAIEKSLPPMKRIAITRINIQMYILIITGFMEHVMYLVYEYEATLSCHMLPDDSGSYIKSFITHTFHIKFNFTIHDCVSTAFIEFALLQSSFVWNFTDAFVILTSMYLVYRFEEFNHVLAKKESKLPRVSENDPILPWSEMQAYYTTLTHLVYVLDKHINSFVFVSFAKIIIIGQQIYLVINAEIAPDEPCVNPGLQTTMMIFFSFSSLSLVLKVSLVSYMASKVYTLGRVPLKLLYTIPAHTYDQNFQRFIDQVYHSNVSLSGLRCFFVSRQMILSVFATLLTYEVVLLQQK